MNKAIVASALGLMGAAVIAVASQSALAKDINATLAAGHPPVFRWVKHASKTFIPAVNKALEGSGHTIKWKEQYAGSLAKVGSVLEAVEEGLAEVGLVSTVFEPAKLSVQNVTYYTPFTSTDATAISKMIDDLHRTNKDFQKTWHENDLEYLGAGIGIDDYLLMSKFPVKSIADLKGKKIGAPGPAVNWLKGTGAVGVSGNLTTYYNEIKTGVYDGVIVFASAALPGKLYEVAPYITRIGFGAQYAGGIAANKDWYDAQPAVVQKALKSAAEIDRVAYHKDLEATVVKFLAIMKSKGATVSDVDENFRKEWAAGMDNAAKVWAANLDKAGKNGTAVLKNYMNAMRKAGATPVRNWDQE
ncbi:MAG: C4-dicarboxylate TRAP transporter substrate-binding protein [Alphaproteobacteria bacterium]|jgi:TRAP-type C4-dicarboxylate transport system substrate-binding protein|nr:C4-dicarboxylate TRAP transporter substrate-binding protein [Alphaproteobacteria bacterium]MBT4085891.1 C4-dicarboxylate TRAP transporter substrate-binding protein [Alphaproteobacteria bacterium]MBT4542636.1 C4-dicarboxylate TRAP transporter substrate-binding protein [Alphaproteobacteria bacterium]MBT6384846.1 C4-dicarboxylate TRAP transporter substrate-binding protein [Alphaproteobacteria bacterium]MBT7746840.1 C4-dicarboxylate TRAP transporter substrate-binding protein [Alphaproteobacteria